MLGAKERRGKRGPPFFFFFSPPPQKKGFFPAPAPGGEGAKKAPPGPGGGFFPNVLLNLAHEVVVVASTDLAQMAGIPRFGQRFTASRCGAGPTNPGR